MIELIEEIQMNYFRTVFIGFLTLFAVNSIFSMQQPKRAWKGRALLLAYNNNEKDWKILLARNKGQNIWSDFSQTAQRGQKGNVVASDAVRNQTNGVYVVDIANTFHYYKQSPSGDWFHFIPVGAGYSVPFISGSQLYSNGRNAIKDDFMWVSVSDILNKKPILHSRKGPIQISEGLYNFLRHTLTDAIQFIESKGQQGAQSQLQYLSQALLPAPTHPVIIGGATTCAPYSAVPQAALTMWGPHKANHIYFYQSSNPYYEFTNFYGSSVNIEGKQWPTTEHYFQAQKFNNTNIQEMIRTAATPREAFTISRNVQYDQYKIDKNLWENFLRYEVMAKAIRAKFNQHGHLRNLLLNTGDQILVEDAGRNDSVWGAGADYQGANHLGRILMHVRDELRGRIPANSPYKP